MIADHAVLDTITIKYRPVLSWLICGNREQLAAARALLTIILQTRKPDVLGDVLPTRLAAHFAQPHLVLLEPLTSFFLGAEVVVGQVRKAPSAEVMSLFLFWWFSALWIKQRYRIQESVDLCFGPAEGVDMEPIQCLVTS